MAQREPTLPLTLDDQIDASNAFLEPANQLQRDLDQASLKLGVVTGLAQGNDNQAPAVHVRELRVYGERLVLAAEACAEAIWELTGEPVMGADIPTAPPRGPRMDKARAERVEPIATPAAVRLARGAQEGRGHGQ